MSYFHVLISGVELLSPVCDGGFGTFSFEARHVLVKVRQTAGHRLRDVTQIAPAHRVPLQIVRQRTLTTAEEDDFKDFITHFWSF